MAKIIWIASYPKSGNTWVRFLIAHLLKGDIRTSAEVEAMIPDGHKPVSSKCLRHDGILFIKAHDPYDARLPLRDKTVGAIYIVRNPLDVIASNLSYLRLRPDFLRAPEDEQAAIEANYVRTFIEIGGDPQWRRVGRGTWAENVASWLGQELPFPRLAVRYIDLKTDAAGFLARVCRFVGLSRTEAEIAAAVAKASFKEMRAMEESEIAAGMPGFFLDEHRASSVDRPPRFLNRGKVGSYREVLTGEEIRAALRRFGPVMARLGFSDG